MQGASLFTIVLLVHISEPINFANNACSNLWAYPIWFWSDSCYVSDNVNSDTPSMIRQNGYRYESHEVVTDDGYILTLFRVIVATGDCHKEKQPVFLQHGIGADSSTWTAIGNRSLAFKLADRGYDVWLGNLRGTRYSRRHRHLNDSDPEFWNYNLDDLAQNDIRLSLRKVAQRGRGDIIYLGHSLGSTLIFMYASEYPVEAGRLLGGIVATSPVVYFDPKPRLKPILSELYLITKILQVVFKTSVLYLEPRDTQQFYQRLCRILPFLCVQMMNFQFGGTSQFSPDDLLTFYSTYPDTTSVKQLMHYGQLYNSDKFQKFDYGNKATNFLKYGQGGPPRYNLRKLQPPVYLYYGKADTLISNESVKRLFGEIGSRIKGYYSVPRGSTEDNLQFNHIDFTTSKYLNELFYGDLFRLLSGLESRGRPK